MKDAAEVQTSNRLVRFPFADNARLSAADDVANAVFGCFTDAMVQLKGFDCDFRTFVTGISLDAHTLSFTLSGKTGVPLTCTRSKTRFPVISGETDWCWYAFVLSSDGIRDLELMEIPDEVRGDEIDLAPRCIGRQPLGVTAIDIYGGRREDASGRRLTLQEALEEEPDQTVSGRVGISEGFNAVLSGADGELLISASPGAGSGTAPCPCETRPATSDGTKRGLWSSDGHIRIFNDTCYDVMNDNHGLHDLTLDRKTGHVTLMAKCKACCTCEMYGAIVNGRLVPIKDAVLSVRSRLERTLSDYESAVRKWNRRLTQAAPDDIVMTMTAIPMDPAGTRIEGTGVTGRMGRCGFSATVRNDSFVDVTVKIESISSNGTIFQETLGYVSDDTPVVSSSARGQSVILQPGKSMTLSYFVRSSSYSRSASRRGFRSSVTVSAYQGNTLITRKSKAVSA